MLKMIIKWALLMWSTKSNVFVHWKNDKTIKILSPCDDEQKTIDKLKFTLEEIHQEASVFDLNTYLNEVFEDLAFEPKSILLV